jgi:regulator of protease activity HflC (stomatin/prohibitin superfamily)
VRDDKLLPESSRSQLLERRRRHEKIQARLRCVQLSLPALREAATSASKMDTPLVRKTLLALAKVDPLGRIDEGLREARDKKEVRDAGVHKAKAEREAERARLKEEKDREKEKERLEKEREKEEAKAEKDKEKEAARLLKEQQKQVRHQASLSKNVTT